ncbi:MAG: transporter [Gammaproteobacteria bacterium RIFCSPHIGHO2_12_FULL_41_15]|nr:MAG: transporter [Gammaproteobacteria bacterium RIFCSPHIGHO2_12_FULL_41_15]
MNLRRLTTFSLVMITVGSVDSIRNLPATAKFGSSLIFFFILAALFFLIPTALVSAQLSSTQGEEGGIYHWVSKALGRTQGFLAIWFQWIENVFWYPTILAFVAGAIGYLIAPQLANSKYFLMTVIIIAFWSATFINLRGMRSSALFSNICAIVGLLIPMMLIISLGFAWWMMGHSLQVGFSTKDIFPHFHSGIWVSLTGVILSFCGMEIATVHARDAKNPRRDFPKALMISVIILLVTLIFGSLAIAVVLPGNQISLVSGIMQAFHAFFAAYHCEWLLPLIAVMLVVGGMGGVSNWIIAPTKGLRFAAMDGHLPDACRRENSQGAPTTLLILQAIIVTIISAAFLLLPSVNASYWLLTALASQLYMLMYMQMFVAGMVLRRQVPRNFTGFLIPGGNLATHITSVIGFSGSLVPFLIGFIPPVSMHIGSTLRYESLLVGGLVGMILLPLLSVLWQRRQTDAAIAPSLNR